MNESSPLPLQVRARLPLYDADELGTRSTLTTANCITPEKKKEIK